MIRVGVLTSSRADYGIYLPLLKALNLDPYFELKLIVFGTHLSKFHGYTLNQIEKDNLNAFAKIESLLLGDSPNAIATSYALTALKFSEFWEQNRGEFDVVFALGDRFEMAAAVMAGIPFAFDFAHIHGGETTLGAIDNIYRHQITLASKLHFPSLPVFRDRIKELLGNENSDRIEVTGSLSLDNLDSLELLSKVEFKNKWDIDLDIATILVTIHPETVDFISNKEIVKECINALDNLKEDYQLVITMPNADTAGSIFRNEFIKFSQKQPNRVKLIENFGTHSYFTCMKHAKLMLGNTSSGIIEAASFNKYVINLGERQKGRFTGENVIHVPFLKDQMIKAVRDHINLEYTGENIYWQPTPSQKIIGVLKQEIQ